MEFNKSNSPINQPLIHYAGILGEFDYDPDIWEIIDNRLRFKNRKVKSLPENLELPKGCVDISYMFFNCKNLVDISPLKNWDISNVKSTLRMFSNCISLTNITTLQSWNTSKVEDMSYMFSSCVNLKDISPLENWNTSNINNMSHVFSYCVNLTDTSSLNKWRYFKSKKHI